MKTITLLSLVLFTLALTGCPKGLNFQLINNTGRPVELVGNGSTRTLAQGDQVVFDIGSKFLAWNTDAANHSIAGLRVRIDGKELRFSLDFRRRTDWPASSGTDRYALMLERDGSLSVRAVIDSRGTISDSEIRLQSSN